MKTKISLFYLTLFFGSGSLFPLFSVYLKDAVGLSGSEIGLITSLGPAVTVVTQPLWGLLADATQKPRRWLAVSLFAAAVLGVLGSMLHQFIWILAIWFLLVLFESASTPISDGLTILYCAKNQLEYGLFRMWGALGFALAAFLMGIVAEQWGMPLIFFGFAGFFIAACILSLSLPKESEKLKPRYTDGMGKLLRQPRFLIFLIAVFFIFGPMDANNTFFGLLINQAGGKMGNVGFGWLIAAGTEVPVMWMAGKAVRKYGTMKMLIAAAFLSTLRFFFYFFEPSVLWIDLSAVAQGIVFGLFAVTGLQYVEELSEDDYQHTAIALFSATTYGAGNWFFTLIGGFIMDVLNIYDMYLFYAVISVAGLFLLIKKAAR